MIPASQLLVPLLFAFSLASSRTHAFPISVHTPCASDYESCGGAIQSPAGNLPCCSDDFYCYIHGPYFSQCRPKEEKEGKKDGESKKMALKGRAIDEGGASEGKQRSVCARPYGICGGLEQRISCCNVRFVCVLMTPLYSQCLPKGEKWFRVEIGAAKRTMQTFQNDAWGVQHGAKVISASDKIVGDAERKGVGMLQVSVARVDAIVDKMMRVDGVKEVHVANGRLHVSVMDVGDVARGVAQLSEVQSVTILDR